MTATPTYSRAEREWLNKSDDAEEFYSAAFPRRSVLELAREFNINGLAQVDALWQMLGLAGRDFERTRAVKASQVQPGAVRAELAKIKRTATKLLDQIGADIPPATLHHVLWRAENHLSINALDDACALREIDAIIDLPLRQDGTRECLEPGLELVRPQLRYLLKLVDVADMLVDPATTGRKSDTALRHFLVRVTRFWTNELGRDVTVNHNQPQNYTDIERFAECCIAPLDPASTSKIKTYLRDFRSDENRSPK